MHYWRAKLCPARAKMCADADFAQRFRVLFIARAAGVAVYTVSSHSTVTCGPRTAASAVYRESRPNSIHSFIGIPAGIPYTGRIP